MYFSAKLKYQLLKSTEMLIANENFYCLIALARLMDEIYCTVDLMVSLLVRFKVV